MKTIVKLAVMLAVLNAVARAGAIAWSYYQFKDAVEQAMIFGGGVPLDDLHNQVLARASELQVPVIPENVSVQREGARTWAEVAYTHPIEYFPRLTYPLDLQFSVGGVAAASAMPGSAR